MAIGKVFLSGYRLGLLLAVGTAMLFGAYPAAMRAVYDDGGNASFMLITITCARALPLVLYCLFKRKRLFPTRMDVHMAAIGGVLQAMAGTCVVVALLFLPGPLVIIAVFSHTLMLLFFLAWRGEIKLDRMTVVTTIIALAGLSLVLDLWHQQTSGHLWGILIAFMAAVVIVLRVYTYEKQMRTRHPAVVGAESFLIAAACTCAFALFEVPHAPLSLQGYGWAFLAWSTMAVATFGMFFGIAALGAFRWSLLSKLEPVFTAICSAWFIGETLKTSQYFGMAVVIGSLILYQVFDKPAESLLEKAL